MGNSSASATWADTASRLIRQQSVAHCQRVMSSVHAAVYYLPSHDAYLKLFFHPRWRQWLKEHLWPPSARHRLFVRKTQWLLQHGFPAPAIEAHGQVRGVGYVVTQAFPGVGVASFVVNYLNAVRARPELLRFKRRVMAELGELVARLHNAGLAHGDLRPDNILLALDGPQPRFCLIDNERNRHFPWGISERARIKNLVQLNMLWPEDLPRSYRWRFAKQYLASSDKPLNPRRLFAQVTAMTERRLRGKPRGGYQRPDLPPLDLARLTGKEA